MRLLAVLLLAGLTAPVLADDAKPPEPKPAKLGLRVVRVMPESHQALLYDKNRGTHVLVEVGKSIEGFTVRAIDEDEVTLGAEGTSIVLAAPDLTPPQPVRAREHAELIGAAPIATKLVDPYAAPTTPTAPAEAAPVDPYGEVRAVEAPKVVDAGEGGVRVVTATGAAPATPPPPASPAPIVTSGLKIDPAVAVVIPATPTETPAAAPTPAAPAPTAEAVAEPSELAIALGRAEVATALTDFAKLAASARGAFTPVGLRLDKLAEGSLYEKAGLKPGDVVTAVDGKPLHSIDDAADLYARAGGLKAATVQLVRNGKPLTLRVAIR